MSLSYEEALRAKQGQSHCQDQNMWHQLDTESSLKESQIQNVNKLI